MGKVAGRSEGRAAGAWFVMALDRTRLVAFVSALVLVVVLVFAGPLRVRDAECESKTGAVTFQPEGGAT